MVIVSATDERYLPGLMVTWGSALLSTSAEFSRFYLLHEGLSKELIDGVKKILSKVGKVFEVIPVEIKSESFVHFPEFFYDSKLPYARLLIPQLIREDRVIYIDVDMIVSYDLQLLFTRSLEGKSVGAVREYGYSGERDSQLFFNENPRVKDHPYFNSGLLLIDLTRPEIESEFSKAIGYINTFPDRCLFWDQTALNVVFAQNYICLEPILNFQLGTQKIEVLLEGKKGYIIHFVTSSKPWLVQRLDLGARMYHVVEYLLKNDLNNLRMPIKRLSGFKSAFTNLLKGVRLYSTSLIFREKYDEYRRLSDEHFSIFKDYLFSVKNHGFLREYFLNLTARKSSK